MSFFLETAQKLNLDVHCFSNEQQKYVLKETLREICRTALIALALEKDGESLKDFDNASVRLQVSSHLSMRRFFKESQVREMLFSLGSRITPTHAWDDFEVGCFPYKDTLCFWHIRLFHNKHRVPLIALPIHDFSNYEFRVFVNCKPRNKR
ncbi:hypothetical protein R7P65_10690 [Vibrio sp. Vb0718]|uniref:hypothetical protein n=1 Tax=Vibrio sp. Vb0718 TaxID=3074630 RepID=UPI002964BEE9|nr:hypothetical protein [Vibrio sp. Vb0718]MDW1835737.1 hypothetical protein [Vibrio sp. Vb0718]